MRRRFLYVAGTFAALGSAVVLAACVDLFHGTSFQTLCDVDASAPGCGATEAGSTDAAIADADAATPAPTDFCALSSSDAMAAAQHACAWLGACEGPYEHNPFGQCMFEALQAFDCTIRPNMKVQGSVFEYWSCLSKVQQCTDVDRCVFVGATQTCPVKTDKFNSCTNNGVTRVACANATNANVHPEFVGNCNAQGRKCIKPGTDSIAFCAASDTSNGTCTPGCEGSTLHDCQDAGPAVAYPVDLGRDCKNIGAGKCASSNGTVCVPSGGSASQCAGAGGALGCSADLLGVVDCRSGSPDEVDCSKLGKGATCQTGPATGPAWDPSSACLGIDGCKDGDTCFSTSVLQGCVNGIKYTFNCKSEGFVGCGLKTVPVGPDYDPTQGRAACIP